MYIPPYFKQEDREAIIAFIKRYSFATLVTNDNGKPAATHLPFIVEEENGELFLFAHMSKANPQWKNIEGPEVLVIFSEPHAYISPKHYDKVESVPTWNYIAVHVYGRVEIIESETAARSLLERTIRNYEEAYLKQWEGLSEDYKKNMVKGITAFKITVTEIQAQFKLSQNKNEGERGRIIETLSASPHENEREIAENMNSTFNP